MAASAEATMAADVAMAKIERFMCSLFPDVEESIG
jgi:hypothetical protein